MKFTDPSITVPLPSLEEQLERALAWDQQYGLGIERSLRQLSIPDAPQHYWSDVTVLDIRLAGADGAFDPRRTFHAWWRIMAEQSDIPFRWSEDLQPDPKRTELREDIRLSVSPWTPQEAGVAWRSLELEDGYFNYGWTALRDGNAPDTELPWALAHLRDYVRLMDGFFIRCPMIAGLLLNIPGINVLRSGSEVPVPYEGFCMVPTFMRTDQHLIMYPAPITNPDPLIFAPTRLPKLRPMGIGQGSG